VAQWKCITDCWSFIPSTEPRLGDLKWKPQLASQLGLLHPLDSGAKRNGLSEADFHVFAKLGEKGLERGLETEAFSRSKVCGEDNLLNVVV